MNRRFLIDAAERVGMTFLEAGAAALIAAGAFNAETGEAALIAGLTAAAAVIKTIAAKFVGPHDTASIVPSIEYAAPDEVKAKSASDLTAEHKRIRTELGIVPSKKPTKKATKKKGP